MYATRPVPEVSPLLKQPVRHHADFSPRGICFSSASRKCGCAILSLGKGGTKSRLSICLSSLADFSPRWICFSSASRKCGCPILSLGKGGTKSPPLHSFVIPRGHQSAGDLLSVCRHQPAAIRSSFLAGLSPRGICFSSAARKCGCPILFPLLGKSGIWRHHGHEWVQ